MAAVVHYLAHHLIVTGVLAVAVVVAWRLIRPAPAEGACHGDGLGAVLLAVAAGVGVWWYLSHHAHPAPHAAPRPRPTVTHVIVQHVTAPSSGIPGWGIVAIVIVAVCVAGAVAINAGQRGG